MVGKGQTEDAVPRPMSPLPMPCFFRGARCVAVLDGIWTLSDSSEKTEASEIAPRMLHYSDSTGSSMCVGYSLL